MKLVVATRSAHKMVEIRRILGDVPDLEVLDLDAAGVVYDPAEEDLEPYDSFEENARSKAAYFFERTQLPTVADDSGLAVDALQGAPGVRSKRFAPDPDADTVLEGEARDQANNEHLLRKLKGVPVNERTGRYVCVAALASGQDDFEFFRGEAEGLILGRPQGWGGFGYDPLFFDPELGKTFAQIEQAQKNARSHRGKAFRALGEHLTAESR